MPLLYLDYASSAPTRAVALAAEKDYENSEIAGVNPNSLHSLGRKAARALDGVRVDIVKAAGGRFRAPDVIFTSGGTEGNNLAVIGIAEGARAKDRSRTTVIMSSIEHDSVLSTASVLRGRGFDVCLVQPNRQGYVEVQTLCEALDQSVCLVSIMYANNETGVVQPIAELSKAAHQSGAYVHTDAVQAFGRIPLQLDDVDALTVTAHKLGGPIGIGAALIRSRTPLRPQSYGGGQEQGRRHGTQAVRGALAFAAVARECADNLSERRALVSERAEKLYRRLCASPKIEATTSVSIGDDHLPGIVNILVSDIDSESLVLGLDQKGFEVSAGSACSSGSLDPSHVLSAMGVSRRKALGSLRISFDERICDSELDAFADALLAIVDA